MPRMIRNSENLLDDYGDPSHRPFISMKAEGTLPREQYRQLGELLTCQFGMLTRSRMATQGVYTSTLADALKPPANRSLTHTQILSDLTLRPPLLMQCPCPQPTILTPVQRWGEDLGICSLLSNLKKVTYERTWAKDE